MPTLSLPDGAARSFDAPVTGAALAASIGPGLAKAALLVEVDGELRDLSRPIEDDAAVRVITARDEDALEVLRPRLRAPPGGGGSRSSTPTSR